MTLELFTSSLCLRFGVNLSFAFDVFCEVFFESIVVFKLFFSSFLAGGLSADVSYTIFSVNTFIFSSSRSLFFYIILYTVIVDAKRYLKPAIHMFRSSSVLAHKTKSRSRHWR